MAEIRLRDVQKPLLDKLEAICKNLGEATVTGAIENMINRYQGDKEYTLQLVKRNNELHNAIAKYVQRESEMKALVELFIKNTDKFNKMVTGEAGSILKKFLGPKKKAKPAGKLFKK